jgi:hypothetical protein
MPDTILVLHQGKVHAEYPAGTGLLFMALPDGCYIRFPSGDLTVKSRNWRHKRGNMLSSLDQKDVPRELKALCLLLGVSP